MNLKLENAVFFAGGKRLAPISDDTTAALTLKKKDDGSWLIQLELLVQAEEAKNVIRKFSDFNIDVESFEDKFPNQVYIEAFADDGTSKKINLDKTKLSVFFDKENNGEILLSLQPSAMGKTQNGKTQNVEVVNPQP